MDYVAQAHAHRHSETLKRLPNGFREDFLRQEFFNLILIVGHLR